jgi:hypothetical protein
MAGFHPMAKLCPRLYGWKSNKKTYFMLYTIAVVLLILWLLGVVTGTVIGGFIHILLVIAIIMILLRVISGSRAV